MTKYGYKIITDEFNDLKNIQRVKIVQEIELAKEHGDLKENAEYHSAKEKQSFIDSRIAELSSIISKAEVIDPSTLNHSKVSFGSRVSLLDLDTDEELIYTIVGKTESDPNKGRISISSPLAKSLLGKEEGDDIELKLPKATKSYEIINISYKEIDFDS